MAAQILDKHLQQQLGNPGRYYELHNTAMKGDQTGAKSKKSPIYVHQFNKIDVKRSSYSNTAENSIRSHYNYSHEVDSARSKAKNSSVNNHSRINSKSKPETVFANFPKTQQQKTSYSKNNKAKQDVLQNKATIDKLEETYWAKWKPTKEKQSTNSPPAQTRTVKQKHTKEEVPDQKYKPHYRVIATIPSKPPPPPPMEFKKPKKSNKHEEPEKTRSPGVEQTPEEKSEAIVNAKEEAKLASSSHTIPKNDIEEEKTESNHELPLILPKEEIVLPIKETSNSKLSIPASNPENDDAKLLKHTDSFILTMKKKSQEKNQFQQPKCIKLYKKSPSVVSSSNSTKVGQLKSCLKKDKPVKGNIRLGRPGSPLIVQSSGSSRINRKKK